MEYTTADFTPIYPPEYKPKIEGWYCANTEKIFSGIIKRCHSIEDGFPTEDEFFYWKNGAWRDSPDADASWTSQEKYWFGLNRKGVY